MIQSKNVYYSIIPEAVLYANITDAAYRVYGALARVVDQNREGYILVKTLADRLNKSERAIRRNLAELTDQKLITIIHQWTNGKGKYSTKRIEGWRQTASIYKLAMIPTQGGAKSDRGVSDRNGTQYESHIIPESYSSTSEQCSEEMFHPHSYERGRQRSSKAEASDPVSPEFYKSDDRQILIQNVQSIAQVRVNKLDEASIEEQYVDTLENNLLVAFTDQLDILEDTLAHLRHDRAWIPPKHCTNKKSAATWLNTFLNECKREIGQLTWRGQP